MSAEHIVRYSLEEIRAKWARGEKSKTDWGRVEAMTDEDIDRATRDDPDWAGFDDIDWSKATVVFPTSKDYQTHMEAIQRHHLHEQKKPQG